MQQLKERDVAKRNILISRKQLQTTKNKVDEGKTVMKLKKDNLRNDVVRTY
jgi:hypothetical protein